MSDTQRKALELLRSIRKNMEKFLAISIERLAVDQAIVDGKTNPLSFPNNPKTMITCTATNEVNDESLAIEKAHKEQMVKR